MHISKNRNVYFSRQHFRQQYTVLEVLKMNEPAEIINNSTKITEKPTEITNHFTNPEYIRAITPLIMTFVGCVIGGMVIISPNKNLEDTHRAAGMGLAGTAITGAAGLAQSNGKH